MIKAVGTTRGPATFTESLSMCDPGRRIVPDHVMRGSRARGVGHASATAVDLVDRAGLCRTAPDFACTRSKIKPSYLTSRPLAQSSIIAREVSSSAVPAFVGGSRNHSPVAPSAGRGRGACSQKQSPVGSGLWLAGEPTLYCRHDYLVDRPIDEY